MKTPPFLELDLHVDQAKLNSNPTVAAVITQGVKRSIERVAPGQVSVIDNLFDTLNAASGDAILAKILFLGSAARTSDAQSSGRPAAPPR